MVIGTSAKVYTGNALILRNYDEDAPEPRTLREQEIANVLKVSAIKITGEVNSREGPDGSIGDSGFAAMGNSMLFEGLFDNGAAQPSK